MSTGPEEIDADAVVDAQKQAARQKRLRDASKGIMVEDSKRKPVRIGSVDPRNAIEQLFMDRFGTVTPVPRPTMGRKQSIITACILYIHYNQKLATCAELCNVKYEYLQQVLVQDGWEEFAQELSQINRPSNLTLVPSHDISLISEEAKRRLGSIEELREKERQILLALKKMQPGSMAETAALANIKKIRDLIERAIGMDDYLAEMTAARKTIVQGHARKLVANDEDPTPKPTRGTVVEL